MKLLTNKDWNRMVDRLSKLENDLTYARMDLESLARQARRKEHYDERTRLILETLMEYLELKFEEVPSTNQVVPK